MTNLHQRRQLDRLASSQHGLITTGQLAEMGIARSQLRDLLLFHGWERVGGQMLRRTGGPHDARQRVAAAVLEVGPGAALSHESAAAWYGHRGSRLERPIHVTTTRKLSRRGTLARIHEVRALPAEFVVEHDGVSTVSAELLALHLFATMGPERAARITDTMWSRRMLSGRSIGRFLARFAVQGRNGIVALRQYYEERGDDDPPASGLESRSTEILLNAGIRLRRQVWVGDAERPVGRVDFADAELPLVVEIQSEMHHASYLDRRHDQDRLRRLSAAGFEIVEIPEEWVWTDPGRIARAVRSGIASARTRRSTEALASLVLPQDSGGIPPRSWGKTSDTSETSETSGAGGVR